MDLLCMVDHMRGRQVLVNGTIYPISQAGVAHVAKPEDAQKLLSTRNWRVAGTPARQPVKAPEPPPPAPEPEPVPEAEPEVEEEVVEEEPSESVPENTADNEWPEPTEEMSIAYLREMARAYRLSVSKRMSKALLVSKIRTAMYESEDEA